MLVSAASAGRLAQCIEARLTVLDWLAGPPRETPTDRAIREEGERFREAFPEIDFDHPKPLRRSSRQGGEAAMTSDLDIWRAANFLSEAGVDAELEAAKRADLMLERGDREGQLVWFRIRRAIEGYSTALGKPN